MKDIKEDIVLVGGGGHCKSVIDVIELENKYNIVAIVDKKENIGKKVLTYTIDYSDEDLGDIIKICKNAIVTIGQIKSNFLRVNIFNKLKKIGFNLPVIISPLAYISKHAVIEEGSIVMHNVIVNAGAKIGKNCIINTKALIEHDVLVEDHCHISTASVLNGGVIVRSNTFYGSNATSKQGIELKGFIKASSLQK